MRAILALILLNGFAYASTYEDELARAHFLSGQSYFDEGRFADALSEYREAYHISQRPAFHYNIGVCEERLGRLDAAIASFERYLREAPAAPDRAPVEAHLRELRNQRLTTPVALVRRPWFIAVVSSAAFAVVAGVVVGVVLGTRGGDQPLRTLPDVRAQ
jgi:tetratricopeptide (TPR) repeat protein